MAEATPRTPWPQSELDALLYVLNDRQLLAAPRFAGPGVEWVRGLYWHRYAHVYASLPGAVTTPIVPQPTDAGTQPAAPPAPAPSPARARPAAGPAPARRRAPRSASPPPPRRPAPARVPTRGRILSAREFFGDHAILLVADLGAFLLLVATVLFELYGAGGLGGGGRFAAVAAVTAVFGVAGRACIRRDALRIVGRTYIAVFALLTPLMLVAADQFLTLDDLGITAPMAVGIGGAVCSLLYGDLARRLGSVAYASLSLVALLAGWMVGLTGFGVGHWTSVEAAPVALLFALVAGRRGDPWRRRALFGRTADVLWPLLVAGMIGSAVVMAAISASGMEAEIPIALAVATGTLALTHTRIGRAVDLAAALVAGVAAAITTSELLVPGDDGVAVALIALAVLLELAGPALTARRLPPAIAASPLFANWRRALVTLGLVTAAALPVPDAPVQAGVLAAAIAGAALVALRAPDDRWLLAAPLAIGGQCDAVATSGGFALSTSAPRDLFIPIALACLTAAAAGLVAVRRHPLTTLAAACSASAMVLTAAFSMAASPEVVACTLAALGVGGLVAVLAWSRLAARGAVERRVALDGERVDCLAALAVLAGAHAVVAAGLTVSAGSASVILLLADAVGLGLALVTRRVVPLVVGLLACELHVAVVGAGSSAATGGLPPMPQLAVAVTALTAAAVVAGLALRREELAVWTSTGLVASALTIDHAVGAGAAAAALELLAIAPLSALAARRLGADTGVLLRVAALAEAVAACGLVDAPQGAAVANLLAAVVLAALIAADTRDVRWLGGALAALAAQTVALASDGALAGGAVPSLIVLPSTLAAITLALATLHYRVRQDARWLLPAAVLATALTATLTAQGGIDAYAAVLVTLALAAATLPLLGGHALGHRVQIGLVVAETLSAAGLPVGPDAVRTGLLLAAAAIATSLAWRRARPAWLAVGALALLEQMCVTLAEGSDPLAAVSVPLTLLALTVATASLAAAWRRVDLVPVVKLGVTLTVLSAERTVAAGPDAFAVALLVLGSSYLLISLAPMRPWQTGVARVGGVAHLIACGLVPTTPGPLGGGLLVAAAAVVAVVMVVDREPRYGLLVTGFAAWAWTLLVTVPLGGASSTIMAERSDIAVVGLLALTGVALRLRLGRHDGARWAAPWYLAGALSAAGVVAAAAAVVDLAGLGAVLLTSGIAAYAAGALAGPDRGSELAALGGCSGVPLAIGLELCAASVPGAIVSLAVAAAAVALAATRIAIRRRGDAWRRWEEVHAATALAAAVGALAVTAVLPSAATPLAPAGLAGLASTTLVAALIAVEARLRRLPALEYAALGVASTAPLWLDLFAGTRNVQAFVVPPAVGTLLAGLRLAHDPRVRGVHLSRALVAAGSGAILVTSGLQALGAAGGDPIDVVLLLAEAVISVLGGIALRNRTLVVAGAAGALGAGLRALQQAVIAVPLYAVFGGAALCLLGLAWALAMIRERWTVVRSGLTDSWQRWT